MPPAPFLQVFVLFFVLFNIPHCGPSYYRTARFWYRYTPRWKTEPTSVKTRLLSAHFMTYWPMLSSFRMEITCLKLEQRNWVRARRVINTMHLVPGRLALAPLDPLSPQSHRVHIGEEVQMCRDESCRGDRRLRNTSTAHPPQKKCESIKLKQANLLGSISLP